MRWTIIYSTQNGGVESLQMTSFHDGKKAWAHAKEELSSRFGAECHVTLYAVVKGGNPIYSEWS
jgi:hypothetical protein